ncbi:MAG: hypothetical protein HUK22_00645 [Thermoguttaceae bacterium]|nr:hypothetical protein [Thermoguttaceae bacterium]
MKSASKILTLALLCILAVGCNGGRAKVTGTVTFDDGTPLTKGTVNFTDGKTMCRGEVNKDGKYEMRTFKPGDGVPPGSYKVYITDTLVFGDTREVEGRAGEDGPVTMNIVGKAGNPVAPKYAAADSSGLTCDVKGRTTYDIVLEGGDSAMQGGEGE